MKPARARGVDLADQVDGDIALMTCRWFGDAGLFGDVSGKERGHSRARPNRPLSALDVETTKVVAWSHPKANLIENSLAACYRFNESDRSWSGLLDRSHSSPIKLRQ